MPVADVVLVHGLWMTGAELYLLHRRLAREGFRVHRFRYSTVRASVAENALRLYEFAAGLDATRLHFVGYSLGGIVTLRMLAGHHEKCSGEPSMPACSTITPCIGGMRVKPR